MNPLVFAHSTDSTTMLYQPRPFYISLLVAQQLIDFLFGQPQQIDQV
jgi:hypothetical protein